MNRILVCTVGGSPEPIINAILQNEPHFVVFLCSGGSGAAASCQTIEHETQRVIKGECPKCNARFDRTSTIPPLSSKARLGKDDYAIEPIDQPDELSQVIAACERADHLITERFGGGTSVIANYTGGTKTMTLGLGIYAMRSGWELQVNAPATGGRPDLIKVTTGDVALLQDAAGIIVNDALQKSEELVKRHDYEGALKTLSLVINVRFLPEHQRRPLLERWQYCRMMSAWDRFDHQAALEVVEQNPGLLSQHKGTLKRLIRAARLFASNETWRQQDVSGQLLVEDLINNAIRCADRHRYDDAFGRLYRSTELMVQLRLRRQYDIRTGDVDISHVIIPEPSKIWLESCRDSHSNKIRIGLVAGFRLLNDLEDPLGIFYGKHRDTLLKVIEKRNLSLFAHGLTPVGSEEWNDVGATWIRWLSDGLESIGYRFDDKGGGHV